MAEVGFTRLTSLERVTTGVDRFPGALGRNLTRSAGRCDFPYLRRGFHDPLSENVTY